MSKNVIDNPDMTLYVALKRSEQHVRAPSALANSDIGTWCSVSPCSSQTCGRVTRCQ